ncbi:MAG: hypothetical protein CVV50_01885 [Spirochaetae bacterium HGW-Spirochaetae-6]|nr:MAG: hypothetical protein CVV50_01885 [Spirochaetae bacterium HGW-Spirochaetae-6]
MKRPICFLLLFLGSTAMAQDYLRFTSPREGWTTSRVVTIAGETSVNRPWIKLIHNGIYFLVPVKNRQFSRRFVSAPGQNQIYAEVALPSGAVVKDQLSFYAKVPASPLKIILVWDTDGTYVDLWITEPTGEICKWNNKQTKTGGTLDIGNDYPGYGPQIYSHPAPSPGQYKIVVDYYSSRNIPQSNGKVFVIRNEGTPHESIREYDATLNKPGDQIQIDVLTIDNP